MSVHVTLCGRLGNNLFQYALGRLVARRHGLALRCRQLDLPGRHPGRQLELEGPATLGELAPYFADAPLDLPGREETAPVQAFVLSRDGVWEGQSIPLSAVLSDSSPRQIRLHGYFQRFEYYADHSHLLRQWFDMSPLRTPYDIGPHDVVLNIRRGLDFGLFGWILPLSYYEACLSTVTNIGTVYICGTDIDDRVREAFAHYDPIYFTGTPAEHFSFIRRFTTIILSNSTFAWWAAYLSGARRIYAPQAIRSNGYAFTGFRDVDLHMRESRYREEPVPTFVGVDTIIESRMLGARLYESGPSIFVYRNGCALARVNATPGTMDALRILTDGLSVAYRDFSARFPAGTDRLVSQLAHARLIEMRHRYADA